MVVIAVIHLLILGMLFSWMNEVVLLVSEYVQKNLE